MSSSSTSSTSSSISSTTVPLPSRSKLFREHINDKFVGQTLGRYGERIPSKLLGANIGLTKESSSKNKKRNLKDAKINPADIGAGTYAILRDPYTWPMKVRFEEAYRTDPVVRSAINRKVSFVLGKKIKTVFDLVDQFIHAEEGRAALSIMMSDQEMLNAKKHIDYIHRKTNFQQKLKGAVIQAKVYGRSALLVEGPKDGYPENIKILNSKLLGQVRIDEYTWQLQQIQYNTNSRGLNDPYNFLNAEDIIYFTNLDYHISPYTIHYGLSDIEPIAHISEVNRILNEEDLKETNYSMWAGFGLLKVPTTRNAAEVQQFLSTFQPGKWTAISQDIIAEVHELHRNLREMVEERNQNEKLILRSLNVPSMILGFEDVQNYATAQEVMLAWKESVIEEERTWINDILQPQWFDTLMMKMLNITDIAKLKAKVMLAFEDIAFENLRDKVIAVLPLYEAGLLSGEKVLEYLGFDDISDQYKALQSKKDQATKEFQQSLQPDEQDVTATVTGAAPIPVKYPTQSPKSLLTEVEKDYSQQPEPSTQQQQPQQQRKQPMKAVSKAATTKKATKR